MAPLGLYIGPYFGPYCPFVGCPILPLWAALFFPLWAALFSLDGDDDSFNVHLQLLRGDGGADDGGDDDG